MEPTKAEIEQARKLLKSAPPERLAGTRIYHFAQALADCRERCAVVADNFNTVSHNANYAGHIAAAIRKGDFT